jgi:hypothetical protein
MPEFLDEVDLPGPMKTRLQLRNKSPAGDEMHLGEMILYNNTRVFRTMRIPQVSFNQQEALECSL